MQPPEPMVPHCACWNPLAPPLEPGTAVLLPLSSDGSTQQEPPVWGELLDLAVAMADLADRATTAEGMPALHHLANITGERVPSACWASLRCCGRGSSAPRQPLTLVQQSGLSAVRDGFS